MHSELSDTRNKIIWTCGDAPRGEWTPLVKVVVEEKRLPTILPLVQPLNRNLTSQESCHNMLQNFIRSMALENAFGMEQVHVLSSGEIKIGSGDYVCENDNRESTTDETKEENVTTKKSLRSRFVDGLRKLCCIRGERKDE
ncbi:hypothetical protein ACF0H5_002026 [Mactra antiquata]